MAQSHVYLHLRSIFKYVLFSRHFNFQVRKVFEILHFYFILQPHNCFSNKFHYLRHNLGFPKQKVQLEIPKILFFRAIIFLNNIYVNLYLYKNYDLNLIAFHLRKVSFLQSFCLNMRAIYR